MTTDQNNHNANLSNTLPNNQPIVNYYDRDEDNTTYRVEHAPDKLFVKISNTIEQAQLPIRVYEFYCNFSYLVYSYPDTKLPILKIKELIKQFTPYSLSKNTINKYINILINKNLIKKIGRFYKINSYENNIYETYPQHDKVCNQYYIPVGNFTLFYITVYNNDTIKGTMVLEHYMASKLYKKFRPSKVCKDLNISRKTYYKYLKLILEKRLISKVRISYNLNCYSNIYREQLLIDYNEVKETKYIEKGFKFYEIRKNRILTKAKSRIWFGSKMGKIMIKYNINYIKGFDPYDPNDAYDIAISIINQYGSDTNAAIIVKGILNDYNWIKIQDNRHKNIKRMETMKEDNQWCRSMIFNHS